VQTLGMNAIGKGPVLLIPALNNMACNVRQGLQLSLVHFSHAVVVFMLAIALDVCLSSTKEHIVASASSKQLAIG